MMARAALRMIVPDAWLLVAVAGLVTAGTLMIRAATMGVDHALSAETMRHLAYAVVGGLAMIATSRIHLDALRRFAPVIYLLSLAALVAVLVIGSHQFGARRWIEIAPGVTVQPSEFAKIGAVLALAAYAADREPGLRTTLTSVVLSLVPAVLILVEPDLGTMLVVMVAWVALMVAWGVPWRVLGGIAALAVSVLPIAFAVAVPDYQRERLEVFFNPGHDPLGSGFTMRQVEVALGGGGLTGRGIDGAASALDGVATRASDFAFAQLGEQMGLLGALLVLTFYAVIGWRGLDAALRCPDRFGRLLAAGLTATIVLQALMHIAVNTRLFPATGIPLPYISTGGSALVGMCISAGLIQAVAAHAPSRKRDAWESEHWR